MESPISGLIAEINEDKSRKERMKFLQRKEAVYNKLKREMKDAPVLELFQRLLSVDAKTHEDLDAMLWFYNEGKWRSAVEMAMLWNVTSTAVKNPGYFSPERLDKIERMRNAALKETCLLSVAFAVAFTALLFLGTAKFEIIGWLFAMLLFVIAFGGGAGVLVPIGLITLGSCLIFMPFAEKIMESVVGELRFPDVQAYEELERQGVSFNDSTVRNILIPLLEMDESLMPKNAKPKDKDDVPPIGILALLALILLLGVSVADAWKRGFMPVS